MLALTAPVLFACTKVADNTTTESKAVTMTVKLSPGVLKGRGEMPAVPAAYTSQIETAVIFVTDVGGNVITVYPLIATDIDTDGEGAVATFETTSAAWDVLVLANYPASFDPDDYTTKTMIEGAAFDMADLQAVPETGHEHGVQHAMMYNFDFVDGVFDNKDTGVTPEEWDASLNIAPVVARFELSEVAGTAAKPADGSADDQLLLKSYTLAGVFMNNIYPSLKLAGGVQGTGTLINVDDIADASLPVWAQDVYTDEFEDGLTYAPATADDVWAYHVAPSAGELPWVTLHLKDVVYDDGAAGIPAAATDLYVPVTAYRLAGGGATVDEFARGTVYQVASVTFNSWHLSTTPSPQSILLTATITVLPWEYAPIEPDLN